MEKKIIGVLWCLIPALTLAGMINHSMALSSSDIIHATIQQFNQIVRNGCDDYGRTVPAGGYFVKFETENYNAAQKAILLRPSLTSPFPSFQ